MDKGQASFPIGILSKLLGTQYLPLPFYNELLSVDRPTLFLKLHQIDGADGVAVCAISASWFRTKHKLYHNCKLECKPQTLP